MCFPEIEKTFAVSSLVLNLFASQLGEFFLPHPVLWRRELNARAYVPFVGKN